MRNGSATSRTCARCAISSLEVWCTVSSWRAGQLELPARLERNRAAAGHIEQADNIVALRDRLPAEQVLHAFKQRADAAAPLIGHRLVVIEREREFLVLGADAKTRFRLGAFCDPIDELIAPLDWRQVDLITRHGVRNQKAAA